jgi:ComF family protein
VYSKQGKLNHEHWVGHYSLRVYRGYVQSLDWLFPPQCAGCNKPGSHWCEESQADLRRITNPHCSSCGLPQKHAKLCESCESRDPAYTWARSFAYYQTHLRKALLAAKSRRDQALGIVFAEYLFQMFTNEGVDAEVVVPIPLSRQRRLERGFNQVDLFARPLALMLHLDFQSRGLKRVKETDSQVGLSQDERWMNMKNAFVANANEVAGKNILLLDDVMTTGATLAFASDALISAGAKEVYAIIVARAVLD